MRYAGYCLQEIPKEWICCSIPIIAGWLCGQILLKDIQLAEGVVQNFYRPLGKRKQKELTACFDFFSICICKKSLLK